jgi:large subunit ribosomal protein L21
MFALVEIAGRQYQVAPETIVKTPLLAGEPGDSVSFDKVLLAEKPEGMLVGAPYLDMKVTAKILEHGKDPKVIVFKKKRRKGYRKLNKHRQHFTKIEITSIN